MHNLSCFGAINFSAVDIPDIERHGRSTNTLPFLSR